MDPMKTSYEFYNEAVRLRQNIFDGTTNLTPVMAWAMVCRACANAENAHRRQMAEAKQTFAHRSDLSFFNNLDSIHWYAKAQVEYHAKKNIVANA